MALAVAAGCATRRDEPAPATADAQPAPGADAAPPRNDEWHAHVREVPGTDSLGATQEAAVAGAMRKARR